MPGACSMVNKKLIYSIKGRFMRRIAIILFALACISACSDNGSNKADDDKFSQTAYISSVDQTECSDVDYCNNIGKLDCGSIVDGRLYYFNMYNEEIISVCGGACFNPDEDQQFVCETMCPPPEWHCVSENDSDKAVDDTPLRPSHISSIDQTQCDAIEYCNDVGRLDCGSKVDGPLYYFNMHSEEIISVCGGACFNPGEDQQLVCETMCPPPQWSCEN